MVFIDSHGKKRAADQQCGDKRSGSDVHGDLQMFKRVCMLLQTHSDILKDYCGVMHWVEQP